MRRSTYWNGRQEVDKRKMGEELTNDFGSFASCEGYGPLQEFVRARIMVVDLGCKPH